MATLVSPGVAVTVTNESFTAGSGPGTVPLIILATEQNKLNSSGDAIAPGTTAANAGKLKLISSQRELLQMYGLPNFNEVGGNAMHGISTNEYGLLAAHSYLGVANRAYTLRADIDLKELQPLDRAPNAPAPDGTYWLNDADSDFGLHEWDGTTWVKQSPVAVSDLGSAPGNAKYVVVTGRTLSGSAFSTENTFYVRTGLTWTKIESSLLTTTDLQYSAVYPTTRADTTVLATGDLWIDLSKVAYRMAVYEASTDAYVAQATPLFESGNDALAYYGAEIEAGSLYVEYDYDVPADPLDTNVIFQHGIFRHNGADVVAVASVAGTYPLTSATVNITVTTKANNISLTLLQNDTASDAAIKFNNAFGNIGESNMTATFDGTTLYLTNTAGESFLTDTSQGTSGFDDVEHTNWEPLVYEASPVVPTGDLADGTLWISTEFLVDVLKNDGTGNWNDAAKITLQPSEPTAPIAGEIWVDTDELDSYPVMREWTGSAWRLVNVSDQSTPNGILFADAREGNSGALDADAPDALAYPSGMLLWNSRYSTRNVKRWTTNYTFEGNLIGDRWVSESGNDDTGVIVTGEKAVRKVIVEALASAIVSNNDIRAESVYYNLITAPGFVELVDEMVGLNIDRKETAFVIGDTPMGLAASGTALQQWASNYNNASSNGVDGLVTADDYLGVYYPSGLATNLDGNEVAVPASHMVLRTIAYNDNVAYPWFAPAGLNRGTVSNASSVGYITDEGEWRPVDLSEGLRDILYTNNINPIRNIPNRGLNVWGQKTRSTSSSAMDRVNVARLMNYIRYRSDVLAQPFIFEPNDSITRSNAKTAFDSFLSNLVSLRGLYDFIVVCDESNNTPDRIDRNELWIDIAIQPVKAIEFIYIPIRIRATGASLT